MKSVQQVVLATLLLTALFTIAAAQKGGTLGGRVVSEDGSGMPGVTVGLMTYSSERTVSQPTRVLTDEEGNFQFNNLPARSYVVSVFDARGYVQPSRPISEGTSPRFYRLGENVSITLIKGSAITGRVTTATGEPMIGTYVSAIRVRDADGNKVRQQASGRQRMTDDRGIYRIYGLQAGTYIVVANYAGFMSASGQGSAYDGEVPTYYPSATRDTAAEVALATSSEVTGVDIRHRGERGHVISGKIIGGADQSGSVNYLTQILLTTPATGTVVGNGLASGRNESENGFAIFGVSDGEYEIDASRGSPDGESSLRSEPRRVTVRGADVAGLELKLAPMGVITGRVVVEPTTNACPTKAKNVAQEIVIRPQRDEKPAAGTISLSRFFLPITTPNEKGDFKFTALPTGRYRFEANLPTENWFVKSILSSGDSSGSASSTSSPKQPATAVKPIANPVANNDWGRNGIVLKSGDRLTGATFTIADGAATLRGKAVPAKEGVKRPDRLRIHIVPAEPTAASETLRYYETTVGNDGTFSFANLAPGKYWLLAKAVTGNEPVDFPVLLTAWDAAERAKLRRQAEAAKNEIELKACQRVKDQVVPF